MNLLFIDWTQSARQLELASTKRGIHGGGMENLGSLKKMAIGGRLEATTGQWLLNSFSFRLNRTQLVQPALNLIIKMMKGLARLFCLACSLSMGWLPPPRLLVVSLSLYPAQTTRPRPPSLCWYAFFARQLSSLAFYLFHESFSSAVPIPHHTNSTDKHITHDGGQIQGPIWNTAGLPPSLHSACTASKFGYRFVLRVFD